VVWIEIFEPIDGKSPANHANRDLEDEKRPSSMIDSELKKGEVSKFSPLPEVPIAAPAKIALDLPKRSPEELRILGRITMNGQ
jgi:hypothetical protein